jgi:crossover junction endodeoxyribonuclease RuvC
MPGNSSPLLRPHSLPDRSPRRPGRPSLILGFDPGLQRTGYGALRLGPSGPRVYEIGVLSTRGNDLGSRLHQLYAEVDSLVRELRPTLVVLEDLFAHRRFPRTAIVLGHVRGIICLAAASSRIGVVALAPSAVKRAVTGSGAASKAQVQASMRSLLGLRALADPHAADALALAYAGVARIGSVRG